MNKIKFIMSLALMLTCVYSQPISAENVGGYDLEPVTSESSDPVSTEESVEEPVVLEDETPVEEETDIPTDEPVATDQPISRNETSPLPQETPTNTAEGDALSLENEKESNESESEQSEVVSEQQSLNALSKIDVQTAPVSQDNNPQVNVLAEDNYFSHDFGDTPDAPIDTSVWEYKNGSNAIVKKDPESTDAQFGKGYSFYTNGTDKVFVQHTFDTYLRGTVTVDFYDDMIDSSGRMAQINLIGAANTSNQDKPYTIGLGINQNSATKGWSNDYYVARVADDGRYIVTDVQRSQGWHTFKIVVTENGSELYIDDHQIDLSAIPESDVVTAFNAIQLGDKWGKGGETYYDNVAVMDATPVDLEEEENARKDATLSSIELDNNVLPGFDSTLTSYTWEVASFDTLPNVTATATNSEANVVITQATSDNPTAIIVVTAVDGQTTQTYTIKFTLPVEIESTWGNSFEEDNLLEYWQTLDSRGTYTELSDDVAHEGTHSFVTRGTEETKSWIFKKFDTPVYGNVSVWFYDTMGETGKESYQQVNIWAPFESVDAQPTISGLGTQMGNKTYTIRTGTDGGYQATSIERTKGWHHFEFDVTSGSEMIMYLDGTEVYRASEITSIGALQMGDIWSTSGATAYYDDVEITEITAAVTGISLDKEKLSLEKGKTAQLSATVYPLSANTELIWTSSNEDIATVDENGYITAGNVTGAATITVTTKKGNFSATCDVTVTMTAQEDASLKDILIASNSLEGFVPTKTEYDFTVIDTDNIPTVTAVANQDGANVEVEQATIVPGDAVITVTAPNGTYQLKYTIHFEELSDIFFDDFSYTNTEDLEKNGNWDVQEGTGRRPGNRSWGWSADNVVLMKDKNDADNTIVRLKASTEGNKNVTQSQIRYYEEKFGPGVYVARVWLYDDVMEAEGDKGTGAWNAQDQALSTFFTINRIQAPSWEPYHESDFEYLFNGGWGGGEKTMWFTTWNQYALATSSQGQTNQVTTSNNERRSLDGQWRVLTIQIDEDGRTTYYIDGEIKASHANKDNIIGPQSIAFNLWFIGGGQDSISGKRTYWEDIDWVYYTSDTSVTTEEVVSNVAALKTIDVDHMDDIPSPDISLASITVDGVALDGFNNDTYEYHVNVNDGSDLPVVEATANNEYAIIDIKQPESLPGIASVYVASSDLSVAKTYYIYFEEDGTDTLFQPVANYASYSMVKYRDVELSHTNPDAKIYYTLDGSTPTTGSTPYSVPIRIETSTNLKAIAVVDGKTSPVADYVYTVIPMTPQVGEHPVANLKTGTYRGPQYLEITMPEEKQQAYEVPGRTDQYRIYYTTDGSIPTVNAADPNPSTKLYEGPIEITQTTTVKYIAVLPGICESYENTVDNQNRYSTVTITIDNTLPQEYKVEVETIENGKISADKTMAKAGDTINVTVEPNDGYELVEGSLKYNGQTIVNNTFTMPEEDVTITAQFRLIENTDDNDQNQDHKDTEKVSTGYDDGGPFTTDSNGNVYDRWGNEIWHNPNPSTQWSYHIVNTSDR